MDYYEITWEIEPFSPGSEILIAELSEIGYESFEETDSGIKSYITKKGFKEQKIKGIKDSLSGSFKISYAVKLIREQNWNKVWESGYTPVVVGDEIYVYAPFHEKRDNFRYKLEIEPRMSFGTAHHETTSLMMEWMLEEEFSGKRVLDMGCGTGILAILAEMMGASEIIAIDNDKNAVDNTRDNIRKNKCKNIDVHLGDSKSAKKMFDIILANINRNILINDLPLYAGHLKPEGTILLSGFYNNDLDAIEAIALKHNIRLTGKRDKNGWVAARFIKPQ